MTQQAYYQPKWSASPAKQVYFEPSRPQANFGGQKSADQLKNFVPQQQNNLNLVTPPRAQYAHQQID